MKTAISIPDEIFSDAELAARQRGWTRSQLYARAVAEFIARDGADPVTEALNAVADEVNPEPISNSGRALIDSGQWEW